MLILLTILHNLVQAVVDLMDKFLISARKIEPISYTFYTVVTGLLLLVLWPWWFAVIPVKFVFLSLFSGALFSLALYVFFLTLSQGEPSRVIPYVFGLVPVFDILLFVLLKNGKFSIAEVSAMCLLIPGALLVSHQKGSFWGKHVLLKTLCAFLFSFYYFFWQYSAQVGPTINSLIWNRIGAAMVLILFLAWRPFREKVFCFRNVEKVKSTSVLFVFKQFLGGASFIFFSFILTLGKISVINSLQGFRYIFILLFGLLLGKNRRFLLGEKLSRNG